MNRAHRTITCDFVEKTNRWEEFDAKRNIMETRHLSRQQIEDLAEELVRDLGLARRDLV